MATTTATKGRPILFGAEMVKAILANRKTQTRRLMKLPAGMGVELVSHVDGVDPRGVWGVISSTDPRHRVRCPYGAAGSRLWVREKWRETGSAMLTSGKVSPCLRPEEVVYAADGEWDGPWRSPIFMPRWASRITLEVTAVRAERLNTITSGDAEAEGTWCAVESDRSIQDHAVANCLSEGRNVAYVEDYYRVIWERINGRGSWEQSPWVWVIEFRRVAGEGGAAPG